MIIEAYDDVVYVSGALLSNQWAAIKTTALLVQESYPSGVVLDFARVRFISRLGEMTFVEALFDMECSALPFLLDNVPDDLAQRLNALLAEYRNANSAEARNTRRMYQAIFSEAWWQRLWGAASRGQEAGAS